MARAIALLVVLALSGCRFTTPAGLDGTHSSLAVERLSPGLHDRSVVLPSRLRLHFSLRVPTTTAAPSLIVLLHGAGDFSPQAGRRMIEALAEPLAAAEGVVVVAPVAIERGPWGTPTNGDAVRSLTYAVLDAYGVDRAQVVLAGYSMGGIGTWILGRDAPFTALIPMGAPPPRDRARWAVPIAIVHGERDELFPAAATRAFAEAYGLPVEIVPGAVHGELGPYRAAFERAWRRVVGRPVRAPEF